MQPLAWALAAGGVSFARTACRCAYVFAHAVADRDIEASRRETVVAVLAASAQRPIEVTVGPGFVRLVGAPPRGGETESAATPTRLAGVADEEP